MPCWLGRNFVSPIGLAGLRGELYLLTLETGRTVFVEADHVHERQRRGGGFRDAAVRNISPGIACCLRRP